MRASRPRQCSARARQLSEYFDDKISALVAELEGRVGLDGLAQVRAEAYSGRIVALLGAIERQVAALSEPGRGGRAETEWLAPVPAAGSGSARVPLPAGLRPAAEGSGGDDLCQHAGR